MDPSFDGQIWLRESFDNGVSAGATAYGGTLVMAGAGLFLDVPFQSNSDGWIGCRFEGGLLYAAVGIPLSLHLGDDRWIYTNPSVGWRMSGVFGLPIGYSAAVGDRSRFNAELSFAGNLHSELFDLGYFDEPVVRLQLARAWRF